MNFYFEKHKDGDVWTYGGKRWTQKDGKRVEVGDVEKKPKKDKEDDKPKEDKPKKEPKKRKTQREIDDEYKANYQKNVQAGKDVADKEFGDDSKYGYEKDELKRLDKVTDDLKKEIETYELSLEYADDPEEIKRMKDEMEKLTQKRKKVLDYKNDLRHFKKKESRLIRYKSIYS
jgi:hypothetical protein